MSDLSFSLPSTGRVAVLGDDPAALVEARRLSTRPGGPAVHLFGPISSAHAGLVDDLFDEAAPGRLFLRKAPPRQVRQSGDHIALELADGTELLVERLLARTA